MDIPGVVFLVLVYLWVAVLLSVKFLADLPDT